MNRRFIPVGHRGAPRELPPNTMAGFRRAAEIGCAMVECDVRRSRDGALLLAHDAHVIDATGALHEIATTDAHSLAILDLGAGEGVPRLEDLVDWARDSDVAIMADMKASGDGVEAQVASILGRLPVNQKIVPGADLEARRLLRAADSALPLSLSLGRSAMTESKFGQILDERDDLAIDAVTFEWPLLNEQRVAALHAAGLLVYAWTVDDDLCMERMVACGVDGIISNRTDMVVRMASVD